MEQYNPGQIKKFLKQLRQREEQYIYYLGQLAFQAGEEGGLSRPEMLEAYRTLKDIKTQTAQWETLLAQLKAAKEVAQRPRCPRCGGEVVKGALYCPSCGGALAAPVQPGMPAAPGGTAPAAPLAPPPPVPGAAVPVPPGAVMPSPVPGQPAVAGTPAQAPVTGPAAPPPAQAATPVVARTCPQCGAPLDEDALFCGNCGIRVTAMAEATAATTPVPGAAEVTGEGERGPEASEETGPAAREEGAGEGDAAAEEKPTASPRTGETAEQAASSAEPSAEETIACPSCWTAVTDLDARFCPNCGAKVRE
ncbi:MAG: zinc ribbon domain-containing protein [Actinobacteria bacterium]|nr:zinc ribbon domain-containing protein [Actinomycetota bacterium]